jgi:hypothetical protein
MAKRKTARGAKRRPRKAAGRRSSRGTAAWWRAAERRAEAYYPFSATPPF